MPFLKSILSSVNLKPPTYVKTIQAISTKQRLAGAKIYALFTSYWETTTPERKERERQIHGKLMDHFVVKQYSVIWGQDKIATWDVCVSPVSPPGHSVVVELLSSFSSAPLHGVTHPMTSPTTGWSTLCVRVIAGRLWVLGEWWGCASADTEPSTVLRTTGF